MASCMRRAYTLGSVAIMSSAIRPGPKSSAARACIHAAQDAAAKASMRCASTLGCALVGKFTSDTGLALGCGPHLRSFGKEAITLDGRGRHATLPVVVDLRSRTDDAEEEEEPKAGRSTCT